MYFFIDTNEKIPASLAESPTYNANRTSTEVALGHLQYEELRDVLIEILLPACFLISDMTVVY